LRLETRKGIKKAANARKGKPIRQQKKDPGTIPRSFKILRTIKRTNLNFLIDFVCGH